MKDILVHLDGTSEDETRLRTAEAIASVLQSHITGLFTNPLPDYAAYAPMDGGAAAAGLLVQIQEDTRQRGNQIEQKFVERFGKLGVSNEVRRIEDLPGLLSSRVVSDARCGDLFVIGQPYRDEPKLNWD
ncbi:universal stress protein, partial [Corallococcus exiguus]|uniref:universal stress protein n=1 Tax=Corallococcus exiguus TaxID=83462 RepID=UPI0014730D46